MGISSFIWGGVFFWEARFVVSQKWSFSTALNKPKRGKHDFKLCEHVLSPVPGRWAILGIQGAEIDVQYGESG